MIHLSRMIHMVGKDMQTLDGVVPHQMENVREVPRRHFVEKFQ
jgi:hypothetical protein